MIDGLCGGPAWEFSAGAFVTTGGEQGRQTAYAITELRCRITFCVAESGLKRRFHHFRELTSGVLVQRRVFAVVRGLGGRKTRQDDQVGD